MADKVRDLMAEPVTVPTDATLIEAAQLMRDADIGDVIVAENGTVRGIITDRDIVVRGVAAEHLPADTPVGTVCSGDPITVTPEDDVRRAITLMRQYAIRRLPVVDGGGLVGVISLSDAALDRDEDSALAEISAAEPNN
ncbi:MAG: CBS domain-containing protein [Micromonosporaceae bacterium]|nr:CBS domain-containing protein [Micromonosporaceae bacterium]